MEGAAELDFDGTCQTYLNDLTVLISEPGRWLRLPARSTTKRLARGDPDFRKLLDELHDRIASLVRLKAKLKAQFDAGRQRRIVELLRQTKTDRLNVQGARDLLYGLELEVVDIGDDDALFGWIVRERYWTKGTTSWLTWDKLFADRPDVPKLEGYLSGKDVEPVEQNAARNRLRALIDARHNDDLVRRHRRQLRAENLLRMALLVFVILGAILIIERSVAQPSPDMGILLLAPLAGAFGATIAGTVKARRLTTSWDLRNFREGLVAQVAVGAAFAAIIVLIFQADLVTFSGLDPDTVSGQVILGFLAGFSEPFSIGTVDSVIGLATPKATEDEAKDGSSEKG